jgi:hypothetical protein
MGNLVAQEVEERLDKLARIHGDEARQLAPKLGAAAPAGAYAAPTMVGRESEADRGGALARRAAAAVVGLAVAVAVTGSFALADRSSSADPEGDTSPAFTDIRAIAHAHGRRGVLRHAITVEDANAASLALSQIEVRAGKRLYLINSLGVTSSRRAGAAPADTAGDAHAAGSPRVRTARRGNRLIFAFHRSAIGSPYRYRWAATIGSNDTSPTRFDRAPDEGTIRHVLVNPRRFRGYRDGGDGRADRVASQGALHRFVFVDRRRRRTRYVLVLDGPGDARRRYRGRTDRRGRDAIEDSRWVNDVGGPGRWRAIWRVAGKRVAVFRFRLRPEFDR